MKPCGMNIFPLENLLQFKPGRSANFAGFRIFFVIFNKNLRNIANANCPNFFKDIFIKISKIADLLNTIAQKSLEIFILLQ